MRKARRWVTIFCLITTITIISVGLAEAATGTLKVTFKYRDPVTGVEQNLNSAFIYLHNATNGPPMEKFLTKANYILGPSNYGDGVIICQVPEGAYYIRITQRKDVKSGTRPYGPPEEGDYTWMQPLPITIIAGTTLDLGTKYAYPFAISPITITGSVRTSGGVPLAGRYVRAQTEACIDNYNGNTNRCGPVKYLALQPTDANGKYSLILKDPGTYYLYESSSWNTNANYGYPPIVGTPYSKNPVTVKRGDHITLDWP